MAALEAQLADAQQHLLRQRQQDAAQAEHGSGSAGGSAAVHTNGQLAAMLTERDRELAVMRVSMSRKA